MRKYRFMLTRILYLYGRIQVIEDLCSRIFYIVITFTDQKMPLKIWFIFFVNSRNKYYTKSPFTMQNTKSRTPPKNESSIKDFFSKFDQIHNVSWIWSHLLKTYLMENFIFCALWIIWSFVVYISYERGIIQSIYGHLLFLIKT